MTGDFGNRPESVTIKRNQRSRLTETTGHGLAKSAVTMGRNTQMEIGGLIPEALMARGTPGLSLILHRAMQGSSHVGLGFIAACDARMAG